MMQEVAHCIHLKISHTSTIWNRFIFTHKPSNLCCCIRGFRDNLSLGLIHAHLPFLSGAWASSHTVLFLKPTWWFSLLLHHRLSTSFSLHTSQHPHNHHHHHHFFTVKLGAQNSSLQQLDHFATDWLHIIVKLHCRIQLTKEKEIRN